MCSDADRIGHDELVAGDATDAPIPAGRFDNRDFNILGVDAVIAFDEVEQSVDQFPLGCDRAPPKQEISTIR